MSGPIRQPFSPEARHFRAELRAAYTFGPSLDVDTELEALGRATRLVEISEWFQDNRDVLFLNYGIRYSENGYPDSAVLERVARSLLVTEELRSKYSDVFFSSDTVKSLQDADCVFEFRQLVRKQPSLYMQLGDVLEQVEPWFSLDPGVFSTNMRSDVGFLGLYAAATKLLSTQDQLDSWLAGRALLRDAKQNSLTPLLTALSPYPADQWSSITAKALLLQWLDVASRETGLTMFEQKSMDSLTAEFRSLDLAALT